jgi:hypothetical protein
MSFSTRALLLWTVPSSIAILIVGWLLISPKPDAPPSSAADDADDAPRARSGQAPGEAAASAQAAATTNEVSGVPPSAAATSLPRYTGPVEDRERANRLREALMALVAAHEGAGPGVMPSLAGEGNQADQALGGYVKTVMQEQFVPMAGSCYETLLEQAPAAQGNVELDFSILGDPSVGGVVIDVTVTADGKLESEVFTTCLRESMYAVVFDAPPDGRSTVTVKQSFALTP